MASRLDRSSLAHLSTTESAALREYMTGARQMLGSRLLEARLFGSRARGQGHEHSDLDIALIVVPGGRAERHRLYDLAFDVGLAHHVQLAPLVIEEQRLQELRERERLIALELDREGIPL